jgi:hypothetical protein
VLPLPSPNHLILEDEPAFMLHNSPMPRLS